MAKQTFTTGQVLTAQQVNDLQANDFNQTVSAKTASYTLVAADKGTRITMSSTSATTITVNTGLFAAGDTLFIQNLNTGVSTITAGTATVSTSASLDLAQYEGGTLYFTSTGVSIFFKAAGASAGGGSGLTLIERATFSSTTSIISGSVFSATYENYLILITVNSATNAPAFEMRMRTGSTTTTSGYTFAQANANTSSTASQYAASNTSAWDLTSGDTTNGTFIRMHMANPYASQFTHFNAQNDWTQSSTTMQVRNQAGFLNNTTSYDKFDIAAQYNVTGQYAVYGFAI